MRRGAGESVAWGWRWGGHSPVPVPRLQPLPLTPGRQGSVPPIPGWFFAQTPSALHLQVVRKGWCFLASTRDTLSWPGPGRSAVGWRRPVTHWRQRKLTLARRQTF